ncbi:MAG: ATP-binding cassette domain-containing protein [Anaerolineales bacterium]|nr:ATP-binding cassette domain-containing protein [Anaerolineales bacterium]MCB9422374.1 ATP-binding cassette domain-containing protein [Ardenticatenaceae bacterium]
MSGQISNLTEGKKILDVQGLTKHFEITKGIVKRVAGHVRAVDDVNLYVKAGETLSIVGESGCGKTTLGRCIVRAIEPTRGQVNLLVDDKWVDLTSLKGKELRAARRHFHMIFQDPYSSLDPRMTVLDIVKEPLVYNKLAQGNEARDIVLETLKVVGLEENHLRRYPHAFSGGQRQRIGIARSLVCNPQLIVCDESVSALDVSIQAQILNLLKDLQRDLNLSYIFIAHDLAVVEHISDRLAVMYVGKIVELANSDEIFSHPRHPYTEALLSAVPQPDPTRKSERIILPGEVANPANPPSGCYFHPRCLYATEECRKETPQWREVAPEHYVACHHADQLQLKGMI